MAVIHRTQLKPTKLELLTAWLPSRPWYRGGTGTPQLSRAGGFRLDDPRGEVGIEFLVVTDTSGAEPATYLVPLTYRGAPLHGAEHALVGTMEHGVLGPRWAYDGCHDPVLLDRLPALMEGRAQAQDQDSSDTPDREVGVSFTGEGPLPTDLTATDDRDGTLLASPRGTVLRLHRVLRPEDDSALAARQATGRVTAVWRTVGGDRVRGPIATV
jgi:hypothetical protein